MKAWDMSIDDWTYKCGRLNIQIDGCDTFFESLLPICPIETESKVKTETCKGCLEPCIMYEPDMRACKKKVTEGGG